MVLVSVSLSRILVESLMQSLAETSTRLQQRQFHTSTSKFLQSFRVLIQESLILVILTLMLLSGRQRLRILQTDSLRTLLSTREMLLVRHLLLLVLRHNSYYRISYIVYRKGLPLWQSFFDDFGPFKFRHRPIYVRLSQMRSAFLASLSGGVQKFYCARSPLCRPS